MSSTQYSLFLRNYYVLYLIAGLHQFPRAMRPDMGNTCAHSGQQRFCFFEFNRFSTHHYCQCTINGTNVASGNRRIQIREYPTEQLYHVAPQAYLDHRYYTRQYIHRLFLLLL